MFEKLEWSEKRFEELARLMSDPKITRRPADRIRNGNFPDGFGLGGEQSRHQEHDLA